MIVCQNIKQLREQTAMWRKNDERIAFVPTMGNLHDGHLSLVEIAHQHAVRVVVSIYVNPLQFAPGEDFASYPRTLEDDLKQLQMLGVDLVFTPDTQIVLFRYRNCQIYWKASFAQASLPVYVRLF